MTAEEIRKLSTVKVESARFLREIAAQLAELNALLRSVVVRGDTRIPMWQRPKQPNSKKAIRLSG